MLFLFKDSTVEECIQGFSMAASMGKKKKGGHHEKRDLFFKKIKSNSYSEPAFLDSLGALCWWLHCRTQPLLDTAFPIVAPPPTLQPAPILLIASCFANCSVPTWGWGGRCTSKSCCG